VVTFKQKYNCNQINSEHHICWLV